MAKPKLPAVSRFVSHVELLGINNLSSSDASSHGVHRGPVVRPGSNAASGRGTEEARSEI